jgi:DNA invertase Pin-like site-specific DNA recombinase
MGCRALGEKVVKVLYVRVSSVEGQKTDRQRILQDQFDLVIEDKCSGSIPFFKRTGGAQILKMIKQGCKLKLSVWQIDRLGRNLRDIINTIHFFSQRKIPISFEAQGLRTLDESGNENPISKLIISILGVVGEMEREQIRERQREGVLLAKQRGVYKGRKPGTKESPEAFLKKERYQKALVFVKRGLSNSEIARRTGLHYATVVKLKKTWQDLCAPTAISSC